VTGSSLFQEWIGWLYLDDRVCCLSPRGGRVCRGRPDTTMRRTALVRNIQTDLHGGLFGPVSDPLPDRRLHGDVYRCERPRDRARGTGAIGDLL